MQVGLNQMSNRQEYAYPVPRSECDDSELARAGETRADNPNSDTECGIHGIMHNWRITVMCKSKLKIGLSHLSCLLFASLLLSVGCGGMSKPSENDAKTVLSHRSPPLQIGVARIKSFQKTNGQEQEMFGVKVYQLDYSAEVEWVELTPQAAAAAYANNPSWKEPPGYVDKETGSFHFSKTEKGWKCQEDGQIY